MTTTRNRAAVVAFLAVVVLLTACTGGTESNAATEQTQAAQAAEEQRIDGRKEIASLSNGTIPIYHGADYDQNLSKRDEVTIRGRYGAGAQVYTLATDDSYPQVFHYYTTYLGQFRAYEPHDTYPPEQQQWRTFEVNLSDVMRDPFVPGQQLNVAGKTVTLQIAETEAEPKTVIRYIVAPAAPSATPPAPTVAEAPAAATAPAAR
jgi:hypothetical protein